MTRKVVNTAGKSATSISIFVTLASKNKRRTSLRTKRNPVYIKGLYDRNEIEVVGRVV
jgi:hypothetical protein